MKTPIVTAFLGVVALMLAGCGEPATNKAANPSASPAKPAAAPTADALLALDRQANEAYLKGDTKFFEGMLSEKFVMHESGQRLDKAAVIKVVAGNKCNVKDWKLEEPQMSKIDADTYVLSYKGTFAGSCIGRDGKAMKLPSPTRAATVWVRSGDQWLAAYHGENLIIDPANPPRAAKQAGPKQDNQAAGHANTATAKPPADPSVTNALMEVEKSLWEAWMAKDGKKISEMTTADLSFQNIFGTHFATKAEALKDWTGPSCDVKSVSVTDGAATLISPTVGILTSRGTALGTCGGQKPAQIRVYGTSFYVKDGGTWKLAFCLNRPFD